VDCNKDDEDDEDFGCSIEAVVVDKRDGRIPVVLLAAEMENPKAG